MREIPLSPKTVRSLSKDMEHLEDRILGLFELRSQLLYQDRYARFVEPVEAEIEADLDAWVSFREDIRRGSMLIPERDEP